jgi:O-antigen/teichoic acid export membrane protein
VVNARGSGPSVAARGTVQLLLARACFVATGYVVAVILARGLGPAAYGIYGVVMSLLLWVEMFSGAGIPGATAQLLPHHHGQEATVERTARGLLLCVAFLLFALCWALAPAVATLFDITDGATLIRVAILDLPFNGLYVAYQGFLNGQRRFALLSVTFVVYALTKLAGTLLLLAYGLSVVGALLVNVLATIGALVFLAIRSPPRGWMPAPALARTMVRIGAAMGLYLLVLQVLLTLDLWFLKALWTGPAEVIGYYVAALNVARLPTIVPSVLSGVLFASLAWALANSDEALAQRYVRAAVRFALVVLVPCCVLIVMYADWVMGLLYSDEYRAGGAYLRLQICAFACMAFLDLFLHALMAASRQVLSAGILIGLVPASVIMNALLIPRFGAVGAACSLLATIVLGTLVAIFVAARRFRTAGTPLTVARVGAAAALMIFIGTALPLPEQWLALKILIMLISYLAFLVITKEIRTSELTGFAVLKAD